VDLWDLSNGFAFNSVIQIDTMGRGDYPFVGLGTDGLQFRKSKLWPDSAQLNKC